MKKLFISFSLILCVCLQAALAQTREITGTVTGADDGISLPGVSVVVRGTTIGTITDTEGNYSLNVPENARILIFTFVGMKSVEETIGDRSVIDVVLETDVLGLEEVVVTSLGITRQKRALGYAVQDMKGDDLVEVQETNIVNSLAGNIAGVQVTNSSGAIGSSARIIIRGNSSFGNNQPLFVIDGIPFNNSGSDNDQWGGTDFGNNAMDIDPNNIESISILKGASAAALWGTRAANGVVLIKTKTGKIVPGQKRSLDVSFTTSTTFDNMYILPKYQNEYGQGYHGEEFVFDQYQIDNPGVYTDYQAYATGRSFTYVDGKGGGRQDYRDESWGPRLDIGLQIPQFDSPYNQETGLRTATPWISHPDNVNDFFETGVTFINNLAITGTTERSTTRISLTSTEQTGTVPNTDLSKINIGLSTTLNVTDKLSATASLNYVQNRSDNLPGQGYNANNVMQSIGGWFGRQVDIIDLKENWQEWVLKPNGDLDPYNWNTNYHNNPYWSLYNNTTSRKRDRSYGLVRLDYQLTDWLGIMGRVGTDYYFETRKRVIYNQSNENIEGGEFWQQHRTAVETNVDVILTVSKYLTSDISINGNIGANYLNNKFNYMELGASALTVPNLFTIGNVTGDPNYSTTDREYESNSVYGEMTLAYKNFVFLSFSGRNDWTSTLPEDNWSYFYPSASLGVVFTDVIDMDQRILSYGKIRLNYAKIGSFAGAYQIIPTYTSASPFNGIPQYRYTRELPPLDLKPEQTTAYEIGVEMKFFMNRLSFDLTYFKRLTNNQIMAVDITPSTGFTSMRINAGEIENKGVELILNGSILKSSTGLNWDISVNWFKNDNMINELYGDLESYQLGSSWNSVSVEARPGEPWGNIYGGGYLRDDQGRVIVSNGLPKHDPDPVLLGNTEPDWTGGITNRLSWKGFQLSFLLDIRKGGDIFSVTDWFGAYSGVSQETVEGNIREVGILFDGVNDDGTPNTTRIAAEEYFQGWWGLHEETIIDGSFVKLRELILGYDIPQSIIEKIGFVNSVNIAFIGRNLALLWTHESNTINIDPETTYGTENSQVGMEQYQIPATRSLGIQLRVNF